MTKRFVKPPKAVDVPEPHTTRPRRVTLPDGEHWIDVLGGYSHEEREWYADWSAALAATTAIADPDERDARELELNAQLATFLHSHIAGHNLCHYGTDEPLPAAGYDLFWELHWQDALAIVNQMVRPPSFFADPKAGASSGTG